MIVADKDVTLILTGNGDVLEPETASRRSAPAAITRWPRRARWSTTNRMPSHLPQGDGDRRRGLRYTNDRLTVEAWTLREVFSPPLEEGGGGGGRPVEAKRRHPKIKPSHTHQNPPPAPPSHREGSENNR